MAVRRRSVKMRGISVPGFRRGRDGWVATTIRLASLKDATGQPAALEVNVGGGNTLLLNSSAALRPLQVMLREILRRDLDGLEGRLQLAVVAAFEAEAEAWSLSSDSGDRLAAIAARAAVRVLNG